VSSVPHGARGPATANPHANPIPIKYFQQNLDTYQNPIDNPYIHRIFTILVPHSTAILFNPSPEAADAAILALTDPSISFHDLARALATSPEALALWMIRPDIRLRLETTDKVVTWRTRLIATSNLTAAADALTAILKNFTRATDRGRGGREGEPSVAATSSATSSNDNFRTQLLELRRAENARRAAGALLRLANLQSNTYSRVEAAAHQPARTRTPTPTPEPAHAPAPSAAPVPAPTNPAPSFETLLAQLAPHLETIASDLGIDPNTALDNSEPQPEAQAAAPHRESRSNSTPPADRTIAPSPTRPGESHPRPAPFKQRAPALIAGRANEHWP
jgi:hypothetical protein